MSDRLPAVAGMFYPGEADTLRSDIHQYLNAARPADIVPRAMIVPHAGYVYSGPVAASAYARLAPLHDKIKRVVLLGPSHRVPLLGMAISSAEHFITPLGAVTIDRVACDAIAELPGVQIMDEAHTMEHSLEVQLPFLQMTLNDFKLVPIVVGDADPDEVADVIDTLWNDETLIVVSSDLSHYHHYDVAQKMDRHTTEQIENLNPDGLGYEDACGRNPVRGLLQSARQHGLNVTTIDLRNSGDTAGPRNEVVGYGSYLFSA